MISWKCTDIFRGTFSPSFEGGRGYGGGYFHGVICHEGREFSWSALKKTMRK